jgi:hypothetical protein
MAGGSILAVFARADFVNVYAHKPLQCAPKGIGLRSDERNCRQHCQTSKRKAVMKFVSLRTKPSRASGESLTTATTPPRQIHTYGELRQQIHDDLRLQHPEWVEPDGKSPICDSYEARLMELLARG